jgi:hypothetical protein
MGQEYISTKMVTFIWVNGRLINFMGREFLLRSPIRDIRACFKWAVSRAKELITIGMAMFIKALMKIIIFRAMACWMAIRAFIRALGRRICRKAKARTSFRIFLSTKASFIMDYRMAEVSTPISCFATKACSMKACSMAKECYSIKPAKPSKATSNEIA